MTRIARSGAVLLASVLVILAGCASPASRQAMTVTGMPVTKKYPATVTVVVTGGATADEGGPTVGNAEMKAAIEDSIRDSGLFRSISPSGGDYTLSVFITKLDRPAVGFSMTVVMDAGWSVTRKADNVVVLRKGIESTFTAGTSDAFSGAKRIGLAVEGAARENVRRGLATIASGDF